MDNQINVGFCVAYDWYLLKHALPLIYNEADQICLSIDKDRISWSGNQYEFNEKEFKKLIEGIDHSKKIFIIQEDYHLSELTPMQNEVRQRNLMAMSFKSSGWYIQLDCDEYFIDFLKFTLYLKKISKKVRKANVCCAWVMLYKNVEGGYLVVDPTNKKNIEFMQIATREPGYEYGRRNSLFNIYTNFRILHQSWARTENEIKDKILNWGHSLDFNKKKYLESWKNLDTSNFEKHNNFHPLNPPLWPKLVYVNGKSIDILLHNFNELKFPTLSNIDLFFKNSLFFSRLRRLRKNILSIIYGFFKNKHNSSNI